MSVANVLFDVLGPVAVLVALGAIVGPRLDLDVGGLSRLAYSVFGPAFVFAALASADLDSGMVLRLVASALAGMLVAGLLAATWGQLARAGYETTAATTMLAAYGNVGNAGLAIVVFALGDDALALAGVLMLTINLTGLMLSVALAQARTHPLGSAIRRAITAPMAVAGAVALAVNVADVDLPLLTDRAVDLLANALIPVMLFTLGLQLVRSGRPALTADLGVGLVLKLAVAPLAAGVVAHLLGLDGDALDAVVIQSAMPPAVFCAVVAIEQGLAPDRVTAGVVLSTLASAVSLPIVLLVL